MNRPNKIDGLIESDDEDVNIGRDWMNTDRGVRNDGFRIGMESSQEQALQTGFNTAFKEALQMALAGGKLQGGICAGLSYPPSHVLKTGLISSTQLQDNGEPQKNIINSRDMLSSSPLQQLLTSNTDLVAKIPSLLNNDLIKHISVQLGEAQRADCMGSTSDSCCMKEGSTIQNMPSQSQNLECTAFKNIQETSQLGEGQVQQQKELLSCEDICSNRSHFWNQLESFRVQAQSLGVVSSND